MKASIHLRRFILALSLAAVAAFATPAIHGNPGQQPTVHLVAIGDLDVGGEFGKKVAEDARNIVQTFDQSFARAGKAKQLKTQLLPGKDVTPDNVLDVIAKLNVGPSDTLVVLYSGHGMMNSNRELVLTFHHGHLPRERLLAGMKAKNSRLMVLLTDCCSGGIPGRPIVPQYEPKPMKAGEVMEWSTVVNLFLRHEGLVEITAAEPGFCGVLDRDNPGSLFTNSLIALLKTRHGDMVRHLDRDGDRQMQWDEILPQLRAVAAHNYRQQRDGDPQQAYATSLGRWMPAAATRP